MQRKDDLFRKELALLFQGQSSFIFLHDAPYILLDEPTSNLDSLNEAVILKSLAEERKDKTVVLVSHRASTMRIADRTYSVENGRMS